MSNDATNTRKGLLRMQTGQSSFGDESTLGRFGQAMSIFKEMHELRAIGSKDEFWHLKRMLSEAVSRGYVEQIPVMNPNRWVPDQEWYRDKETGEIYRLDPPGERGGWWDRVDPKDLVAPDEKVH